MLHIDRLCRSLVAIAIFQEYRAIKEQMSKSGKASKLLLQQGIAGARKDERRTDSKWFRLLSLRKGTKAKTQCNGGRSKVSPIRANSRSERRRRTVSEIIINVLESDSDNDCFTKTCETDVHSSSTKKESDSHENSPIKLEKKTRSPDETANGTSFKKPSRQSTFDEKITPIGRLLVPVRQEGEAEVGNSHGFNSLFISPESPLESEANENKPCRKWRLDRFRKWFEPAENAVNLKIFGGNRGLSKERQRMTSFSFLIHPYSVFR